MCIRDRLWDEWEQAGCTNDSCVAFPALTCLAETWNTEMSLLYGQSIGEEARYRNKSVLLGPDVYKRQVVAMFMAICPALPMPEVTSFPFLRQLHLLRHCPAW